MRPRRSSNPPGSASSWPALPSSRVSTRSRSAESCVPLCSAPLVTSCPRRSQSWPVAAGAS
eukprot:3053858-Alexandrium_andersonii.AAC.1